MFSGCYSINCDQGSTVVKATRLTGGAGGATLDGGVLRVLRHSWRLQSRSGPQLFGSLAYVADCYDELHLLKEAKPVDNESLALSPPPGLLGADLEVLIR